mmetsp:Transcript_3588/g.5419  ORF Transcript_3588/g.5419 Transcript_3588/m.5419 type:complete len:91 (+) Transcript_3588:995-1267(+)
MANSVDILMSCYDGKILAVIDQKKFKKMGIMAKEDDKPEKKEDAEATLKAGKKLDKEKKEKVEELEEDVEKLLKQVEYLEQEINQQEMFN